MARRGSVPLVFLVLAFCFPPSSHGQEGQGCFQCPNASSCSTFQSARGCSCTVDCSPNCRCTVCGSCYNGHCLWACLSPSTGAAVADPNRWWRTEITARLIPEVERVSPLFAAFLDSDKKFFLRQEREGKFWQVDGRFHLRGKFSGLGEQKELDWELESVQRANGAPTVWTYNLSTRGDEANRVEIAVDGDNVVWTLSRDAQRKAEGAFHVQSARGPQPTAGAESPDPSAWWRNAIGAELVARVGEYSPVFASFLETESGFLRRQEGNAAGPQALADSRRGKFSGLGGQRELDWTLSIERAQGLLPKWVYRISTRTDEPNTLELSFQGGNVIWMLRRDARRIDSGVFRVPPGPQSQ